MSSPVRLASFCRLCLTVTKDKVPVFESGNLLENLLQILIEIQIDPEDEPGAVVCLDCVVTLEGFQQFKEQCHANDEFVKTIAPKLESSASSAKMYSDEEQEEEEVEDDREGFLEVEELQEVDCLELSDAEEMSPKIPQESAKCNRNKAKAKSPVQQRISRASTSNKQEKSAKKPSIDEMQVLAESYPDFFYFEKGSRSIYYTLVFRGERFNSALFSERSTYWQCIHRRKYQCPAQVWVSNDYKTFQKQFDHNHFELPEKNERAFTPHEALPEIFQLCKEIIMQKRTENVCLEDKSREVSDYADSDEEAEVVSSSRSKRKIKPNTRYADGENKPKKQSLEPEAKPKNQATDKSEPNTPKSGGKNRKPEMQEMNEDDLEDDTIIDQDLDLEKMEEECKGLKIRKRSKQGPSLDEQLVLASSYPDYFFFEKVPRCAHLNLVYYGERFYSAVFTEYYTYWHCRQKRRHQCPALVRVTNDYKTFERRHEHNHPDLPAKEEEAFTPMEALPKIFEVCRDMVLRYRAKRRKKLLEKHKLMQAQAERQDPKTASIEEVFVAVQDDAEEDITGEYVEELLIEANSPPAAVDDPNEEAEVVRSFRPKRKTKPNARYAD